MKLKVLSGVLAALLSLGSVNAQIVLEENRSLSQIQNEKSSNIDTPNVSKVRKQVEVNASIVATGIICGFPSDKTESLHNFFLLQFGKYNFTKEEALMIANIHKDKVSQVILLNRGNVTTAECETFKPEFEKIYEYAKDSVK